MWMETKIKVCFIAQINVLWTRWQFGKLIDLPSNVNLIFKIVKYFQFQQAATAEGGAGAETPPPSPSWIIFMIITLLMIIILLQVG